MLKIGLLSDTHGYFDPALKKFFQKCDELWHAGDIGNIETADQIAGFKPLTAVYGNIDSAEVRTAYPMEKRFTREGIEILLMHIGGYPGRYPIPLLKKLQENPPGLFICGHSHILKIIYDKKLSFLHINPGAAGKSGFHQFRTAIRFELDNKQISNLEIWEIKR